MDATAQQALNARRAQAIVWTEPVDLSTFHPTTSWPTARRRRAAGKTQLRCADAPEAQPRLSRSLPSMPLTCQLSRFILG